MLSKVSILDVGITNETDDVILEYLLQRLKLDKKLYIVTPNPEILVYANRHDSFKKILNDAEISLADGTGLFLASIFLAKPLKQRIPGVNFVEEICKNTVRKPVSIGFLGGGQGVAQRTAECLLKKYPGLMVSYVSEEWKPQGFENGQVLRSKYHVSSKKQEKNERKKILNTNYLIQNTDVIDILFVAFGHPKQEEWIHKNLDKLPVKCAMGVGGAFDYISGGVKRAPFMIRAIGLEWLYRLIREPWRWRRQLSLFTFIKLVFQEMVGKKGFRQNSQ
jgi:N-acetylglucosaminyldiphosphoundecaprenol N-acetyl-beta-D-mannosaminyltransferase